MTKRILVTGGAGFLGSHLCRRLIEAGHHVLCLDNFSTGAKENIEVLLASPLFELKIHDVTQPFGAEVDEIYNLACPASPLSYQRDPILTTKTSVFGAIAMLELARRSNAKILQASTSEIYGDPAANPQTEDYWGNVNPIGVRACYNEAKRCAETLFFDYGRQHGVRIKIARIFNTYGPTMQLGDGRVVPNFIIQALRGEPITVFGDGRQTRSFCYVDDMVSGFIRLMDSADAVTGPVNLGNPEEITVLNLAKAIIARIGSRSAIEHAALPGDDPKQRQPDITRARELLGWRPSVALAEGLDRTIADLDGRLRAAIP